jgi:hypothetical protein
MGKKRQVKPYNVWKYQTHLPGIITMILKWILNKYVSRDSAVVIATGYGLDD